MQSDGNSFWGDVVSDGVHMPYSDADSILDQTYEKNIKKANVVGLLLGRFKIWSKKINI